MLCSLFSIFDPSSSIFPGFNFHLKWMALVLLFLFQGWQFFTSCQSFSILMLNVIKLFMTELTLVFLNWKVLVAMITSIFFLIFIQCEIGLLPYLFTPTSHLSFNLSLSIPLWLTGMIFMFISSFKKALAHLVPTGCPMVLIPFLILIETTSLMIRPFSLSIRLMSNMMAGHMVLVLISEALVSIPLLLIFPSLFMMSMFIIFELCVAVIQAYVFSNLIMLYWKENWS